MTAVSKVKAYLELMRYKNCLMAGFSALIAVFIPARGSQVEIYLTGNNATYDIVLRYENDTPTQ